MFRKGARPPSPAIELKEMPPWSGDRTNRPRTGYTPPQILPGRTPLPATPAHDSAAPVPSNLYGVRSPTVSTMTSDGMHSPHAGGADAVGRGTPSARAQATVDVITAQIHRALGLHDGGSEILDDDTLPDAADDDAGGGAAAWHAQGHEELFRACVGAATVDVDELRRIVWAYGVPERPWARALAWKLLADYLPPDRADWDAELAARRARYWHLVSELTAEPGVKASAGDHPLCDGPDSTWGEHFRDIELRATIARDAARTHPDMHRFVALRDALQRVLFVYAKRHPVVQYRQGMNELAAPFVMVFTEAPFEDASDAEADAYFCFERIMQEMCTCYAVKETANAGISKQLRELQALLRIKDPQLESHLTRSGVDARFFGLRWLRLWLSQEFEVPDCLRIWDSLLTAEVTLPWLRYVCVAMVIRIREELLATDFAGCMKLLLHYPPCDVAELLRIADRLRTSNVVIVRSVKR